MSDQNIWTVARAKARLSEMLQRAQTAPQIVTRNGTTMAVVVSSEAWARKTGRRGTLAEFFQTSPLRDPEVEIERLGDGLRDIDL